MKNAITAYDAGALVSNTARPLDQNAAAVYLAGLSTGSRPAMQGVLNILARLLGARRVCNATSKKITCLFVNWAELRFQQNESWTA